MYDPPEELLERLRSDAVTEADVYEFLWGQHDWLRDNGHDSPPVSMFFAGEGNLLDYRSAKAWWPKHAELPAQFAFPTIYLLCWSYQEQDPRIGATFLDRLTLKASGVVSWMTSAGVDPAAPNESPEERKARLNREAQKRHRLRKGSGGSTEEVTRESYLKGLYDAWQAAIGARTTALADMDTRVREAEAAYHAVCAERRLIKAQQDENVSAARKSYFHSRNNPPHG